jgi:phosphomannomutase/phosphoglucomutase
MDGTFPNHHPDPTVPANLEELIACVREKKLDAGIAFDGDADRIGVIDDKGNILWGDELMIIFSRDILKTHPHARFISEVKASQAMYDDIVHHGGKAIMWKTGHSLIKEKMKEVGAVLAGEMSGHMFFADRYFGYDDAIYAAARLIEIMSRAKCPLSALLSDLPKRSNTPEIRVDCPDEKKFDVVAKITSEKGLGPIPTCVTTTDTVPSELNQASRRGIVGPPNWRGTGITENPRISA